MKPERRIILVDMDAFFAAIEAARRPRLRGKPIVVIGGAEERSAVNAATYEAKSCGIKGGMSISQAKALCPDAIFVQADLDHYIYVSARLVELFERFSPLVEPYSIDEAYIDITGTERLFGGPLNTAKRLKDAIRSEFNLVASVGIAPNKTWAKIACSLGKPNGLTILLSDDIRELAKSLQVEVIPGVGKNSMKLLHRLGIYTVAQLADFPSHALERIFGVCGLNLHLLANGIDETPVIPWQELPRPKSVGHEYTFPEDISEIEELLGVLAWLTEEVVHRLRAMNAEARTVQLKIRFSDFRTILRRKTTGGIATETDAYKPLKTLLMENLPEGRTVRQIGVTLSNLVYSESYLPAIEGIFGDTPRKRASDAAQQIQQRWGKEAIRWGKSAKWLLSKGNSMHVSYGPSCNFR